MANSLDTETTDASRNGMDRTDWVREPPSLMAMSYQSLARQAEHCSRSILHGSMDPLVQTTPKDFSWNVMSLFAWCCTPSRPEHTCPSALRQGHCACGKKSTRPK
eukprot:27879-Karenia_brevis.AAC.1